MLEVVKAKIMQEQKIKMFLKINLLIFKIIKINNRNKLKTKKPIANHLLLKRYKE